MAKAQYYESWAGKFRVKRRTAMVRHLAQKEVKVKTTSGEIVASFLV
jgi:hypothetical protein